MSERGWKAVAAEDFDARESVGGLRGIVESSAPGVVFVVAYLTYGGFRLPTIAAVATVVVAIVLRLVQRQPVAQALGGLVGVLIGAAWAWIAGEPGEYFVPGFVTNAAFLVIMTASVLVRWPAVGFMVAFARGASLGAWREDPRLMTVFSRATLIVAGLFALRLAVQLPLYFSDQIAAVGIAKLAMGIPLFVLTAWIVWNLVRGEELPRALQDQLQPRQ